MVMKQLLGRLVFGKLSDDLASYGQPVEDKLVSALNAEPIDRFADLHDLKNLKGESTGYVKTWTAPHMDRLASLSIDILPGMRYFNIHAIPDHNYLIPRFNFEGMISTRGSQASMDLYPDEDVIDNYSLIQHRYAVLDDTYNRAKKHKHIHIEASRLPHMRALCSPYFLMAKSVSAESVGEMQDWALNYVDAWLAIWKSAERLDEATANARLDRRIKIARLIIDNDPDRHKVVDVYGEEMTQAIERATML